MTNLSFPSLSLDDLSRVSGGMFKKIENGRPVWVLTQSDIKKANGNFPLDPRNSP